MPSSKKFRFGNAVVSSMGDMAISIPVPRFVMRIRASVVPLAVPLLLGLDSMEKFSVELEI
jgi:hypothetical protein